MRAWVVKFKANHSASNMNLLTIPEQRVYFLGRMERELLTTMSGQIRETTSIDECFILLEARFLEIHPLFGRRLAWKQCKKKATQRLTDYYHQLLLCIGDEAELEKL